MPLPTVIKYGREASQPPSESNLSSRNRAVIKASTGFFSQNALRKTRYAIPYGAVIADLGTPTTGQSIYPREAVSTRNLLWEGGFPTASIAFPNPREAVSTRNLLWEGDLL